MQPSLISILVPTRDRPENVLRLVNSINQTAFLVDSVEIIFYVDNDDNSFPEELDGAANVKVVYGHRVWISLAWNCLYSHSKGEILMYSGDDVVFETPGWDKKVRAAFNEFPDSFGLVYGNDGGWYAGKLAINGFIHRSWADLLGYFAYPARLSAIDLWIHECASFVGRVTYLDEVMFRHIHYRQGAATAKFDKTYEEAYNKSVQWGIFDTYRSLIRERRIDKIILCRRIGMKIPREPSYFLAFATCYLLTLFRVKSLNKDRILTFTNAGLINELLQRIFGKKNILKGLS